ncbi:MAG: autotransporter domain-containing protein, partial [Fusobacterium periodonticum]|nr:autotransporter domain-containing protein [Fusobacterium periodonticum]
LKSESIGMYAVGNGSTAKNYGTINLSGKNTVGMYLDQGAIGENHGTITTVPNSTNDGIKGVVALNGAIFKNYGNITINSPNGIGYYYVNTQNYDNQGGTITVSGDNSKETDTASQSNTTKRAKGIEIEVKIDPSGGSSTATVIRNGTAVKPIAIDTNIASPSAKKLTVGDTTLDLSSRLSSIPNMSRGSEIGMYVDTSGVNYTNPIQGLNLLTGLQKVDLIFGTEASKYTNEKDIEVGQNILKPYNDVITSLSGGTSMKFSFTSGSLTWIATATQNTDDTLKALYLSKIPYTAFAKDKNTGNFLAGLEQRYGVEGLGTREKALFDKLNGIGKGEAALFAQAVDQMKGHQYSNVQQRIQATGNILDREFDYLKGS